MKETLTTPLIQPNEVGTVAGDRPDDLATVVGDGLHGSAGANRDATVTGDWLHDNEGRAQA
jgi:hypothetical protein